MFEMPHRRSIIKSAFVCFMIACGLILVPTQAHAASSPQSDKAAAALHAMPAWAVKDHYPRPDKVIIYKHTSARDLTLSIFNPTGQKPKGGFAAMVFFHGGGWVGGSPAQFYRQSAHLADEGMVAMSASYRLTRPDHVTPFECVQDAFSAMRWVRAHADELGIDPNRIAAGGGSAGGQLAAAVATLTAEWTRKDGDNLNVSPRPNALVLFNPVYKNGPGPGGWGYHLVKARWKTFSPMNNIAKGMCPTLVMFGTRDQHVPVKTALEFQKRMKAVGSRSDLVLFGDAKHAFFNKARYYDQTVGLMDVFLRSLGYLPTQRLWATAAGPRK